MERYVSKIMDWPVDERPRERFLKYGPQKASDVELLAILLRVGGIDLTAIDLARCLIKKFGSFRGIDSQSIAELCTVDGIGPAKAVMLKAALEMGKRLYLEKAESNQKISSSEDIYQLFRLHVRDSDREIFKIVLLTSRNQIILEKTLFEGSLAESLVAPREVVKEGVTHAAAGLIFVHNHPSGDPSPSNEDKRITQRLKMACELVGIRVLDHVIIGKDSYFSFSDNGLL
jgi:DNA repair protein RadC